MATDGPTASAITAALPDNLDLHILSPSPGVPQPLLLHGIPTTTTIRQLKDRLRNTLDAKPADNAQRLIHRGRLLACDDDTLLDVFGQDAIRSAERQTLHLVLRDALDAQAAPAVHQAPPNATPAFDGTAPHVPATANPFHGPQPIPGNASQQQAQFTTNIHNQPHPLQQNIAFGIVPQVQVRVGHGQWPPVPVIPNAPQPGVPQFPMHGIPPMGHAPNLPPGYTAQQFAQHQLQWTATMNAQLAQRRMEEFMNHNRADRGRPGPGTPQDGAGPRIASPAAAIRTSSPYQQDATRTIIREGIAPNGQQWRIVTNEAVPNPLVRAARTGSPFSVPDLQHGFRPPAPGSIPPQPRSVPPGAPFGGNDVHNILNQADANQATRAMTDAMRRNASTSSLATLASNHSAHPIPPGVTIPSRTGSAAGTPDPLRASGFARPIFPFQPPPPAQASSATRLPEVYILSSPTGPRALLVNSDQHTYFTPQGRGPLSGAWGIPGTAGPPMPLHNPAMPFSSMLPTPIAGPQQAASPLTGARLGSPAPPTPQAQNDQAQGQAGPPLPLQGLPQPNNVVARPHDAQPGVQLQEIRMIPIWPHIWMVFRLALFVWWFTTPESSWSRWLTVISMALGLFLANTGILNPLIEHFWVPVRVHIENLMPLADNHGRRQPARDQAAGAAVNAVADDTNAGVTAQQPTPAATAARLVEQRRNANAHWLLDVVRRLERAGLIFLASIAPGVAERHIEHLEAEARAERQLAELEATRAAEEAEREATAQTAAQSSGDAETTSATETTETNATANIEAQSGSGAGTSGDFQQAAQGAGELRQRAGHETTV
ncbi:homocysteine-responsive endoplasmic reticulum-resident ubiquitin-like domain member 1 protein [Microdochium nivale]|nr:homocysteine-responsive endoplasmic reticulum-resident ubiquitin-like domain member 1 protein [Microdochium nivale]